jgi:hypothetical protein
METPTITISMVNAHVGLNCWFNQVSMLFAMFEKLHINYFE